ncbi:MAG: AAA family ATPase [Chloroflexota bacterium]
MVNGELSQQQTEPVLADPFARIFADRAEADWAFDFLLATVKQLGIAGTYDERFALTLVRRAGRPELHLTFGGWLVAGLAGPEASPQRVELPLLAGRVAWDERLADLPFTRKEGAPEVRAYRLPLALVQMMTGDLQAAFEATLAFIAEKFRHWKRPPSWQRHNPEIIEALFDPDKRDQLFVGLLLEPGLRYERYLTAFSQELAEEEEEYGVDVPLANKRMVDIPDLEEKQGQSMYLQQGKQPMGLVQEQLEKELKLAYARFQKDVQDRFVVKLRRKRAEELRLLLSNPDGVSLDTFNREVWVPNSGTYLQEKNVSNFENEGFDLKLISEMEQALEAGELELHGNYMWGTASKIYAPRLKDDTRKAEYIREALDILNDSSLSPLQKVQQITKIYGFGNNIATGLVMVFHPNEFGLYNEEGKRMLKNLGYGDDTVESINTYEETLCSLKETLSVKDFLELDWFLYRFNQDKYRDHKPPEPVGPHPPYPLSQLAADTGFDEAELARWVRAVERKGQAILYGPPGTGKTFLAEKLAEHLAGGGDGFVELVQFHPAYAYEDFIQGIRPRSEGGSLSYPLLPGRFLEFCQKAATCRDACVLILDEINRANLARVFGELMYLLEYRERAIPLAGGERFKIPANVRLIGTMNTADRSIALVDHALRRRFAFIQLKPNFEALSHYHRRHNPTFPIEALISELERLNLEIGDGHYAVGITFFMHENLAEQLADIWQMEIEPYLEEYFFNQRDKLDKFRWDEIKQKIN